MKQPTALIILDGWGVSTKTKGNVFSRAQTPNFTTFTNSYPYALLQAAGRAVGLPEHEDGNSETGHINLGAGRVVYQDITRIHMAIEDGSFYQNKALEKAVLHALIHKSTLHVMGLVSDSGVHASLEHLYAVLRYIKKTHYSKNVYLHLFTDGRDSPPNASKEFLRQIETFIKQEHIGVIATLIGRYYAMDRDTRWDRTKKAYDALTTGCDLKASDVYQAIDIAYNRDESDEFISPTCITDKHGAIYPRIADDDAIIFFNFRIDRPRQLTRAFVEHNFETNNNDVSLRPSHVIVQQPRFHRKKKLHNIHMCTMTEYEKDLAHSIAFPPFLVLNPVGRVFATHHLRQLRIAESEKERFITYYFNGMIERPFKGEDRLIIPSPAVATYDLKPEMSAFVLTDHIIHHMQKHEYDVYIANYANPDMVGHTGNMHASIQAVEIVDKCIGRIVDAVLKLDGSCIITADHGNVEELLHADGGVDTEHSSSDVPCIVINKDLEGKKTHHMNGKLADVAPTLLSLLDIPIPKEMTGTNILTTIKGGHT